MTTLIKRNACINDVDESLHPHGYLFKDVSELDFFTLFVLINFPTFRDTVLLLALRGFMDLVNKSSVN